MNRPALLKALAALAALVATGADAAPLDKVVGRTIRANYGALHGCFRKALAQDRSTGGTLFVTVTLGAADSVHSTRVEKDGLGHKATTACILTWIRGWTFRGAAASGAGMRSEITIPITFRPVPKQFAVRLEDAARASGGYRELLTPKNSGATAATMSWIKIEKSSVLTAGGPADRVLYVLAGRGRCRAGRRVRRLRPGMALWASAKARPELWGPLEGILVAAPRGAAGEARLVVAGPRGAGIRPSRTVRVWPLLTHRHLKHRRISAGLIELKRGEHAFPAVGQAELLYVLKGQAEVTLAGGAAQHVGPGHGLYVPPGTAHRIKAAATLRALQIHVPAGPERRYLTTFKRGRP